MFFLLKHRICVRASPPQAHQRSHKGAFGMTMWFCLEPATNSTMELCHPRQWNGPTLPLRLFSLPPPLSLPFILDFRLLSRPLAGNVNGLKSHDWVDWLNCLHECHYRLCRDLFVMAMNLVASIVCHHLPNPLPTCNCNLPPSILLCSHLFTPLATTLSTISLSYKCPKIVPSFSNFS